MLLLVVNEDQKVLVLNNLAQKLIFRLDKLHLIQHLRFHAQDQQWPQRKLLNQVICHGIPDKNRILKEGDIINIDVTVIKDGWHGDTSKMYLVGKCQPHNERLVKITQECLYKAIEVVKPGGYLGDIGHAIQQHAESNYYSVVEDYCGHGIGNVYHEEPQILHYGKPGKGTQILEGMCFTIEPMINQGSKYCKTLQDGWTVETKDGRNSAQWEHTLAVTKNGVEVLTKRHEESI